MGALANAAALMKDDVFRDWCMASSVYQSRLVVTEADTTADHAVRLKMADRVITSPRDLLERFVNVLACDPDVAAKGGSADLVGEALINQKMGATWTPLAKVLFPPAV